MGAYHPDANKDGPFEYKDAEKRFKAINDSKYIDALIRALGLATGEVKEAYAGDASKVINLWIQEYESRTGDTGELRRQNERLSRHVVDLMEKLSKLRTDLERTHGSGFSSATHGAEPGVGSSDKEMDAMNKKLELAEIYAKDGRYDYMHRNIQEAKEAAKSHGIKFDSRRENEIVGALVDYKLSMADLYAKGGNYDTMNRHIQEAKNAAKEHGMSFDTVSGRRETEIVGNFVDYKLNLAGIYAAKEINENMFTRYVDEASKAAADSGKTATFKRQIDGVVRDFISQAMEMGKSTYSTASQKQRYTEMAKRVGEKYGVRVN